MKVSIFDLRVHDDRLRAELLGAVERVLKHGRFILGPEVDEFEAAVAKAIGTRYAVGVGSGSSALYLALKSIGIGPGDEVITTPLTWILTLNAIAACGATPVCVDTREDFNIDPGAIEAAITKATKAIVPVHFSGLMCEMDKICEIAERNDLLVVEDAAQAYGARYKSKMAGAFSKAAAFSMNTMKVLASYGEVGAVTTDDHDIYETVRMLRYSGTKSDPKKVITNECYYVALNHKIDTIQAAMLLVAMRHLPQRMARRNEITRRYTEALSDLVKCPRTPPGDIHAYFTYAILTDRRNELKDYLAGKDIETKIYHIPLASEAPVYAHLKRFPTPVAQKVLDRFLSIPSHEKLSDDQVDYVIDAIRGFFKNRRTMMSDKFVIRTNCRMCDSNDLELALPLNPLPIGDRYVPYEQKGEVTEVFPMDVQMCRHCGHLQNSGFIKPEFIYRHYLSRPATTNPVLSQAYKEYADYLLEHFREPGNPLAVEAGSNDGAFSRHLKNLGLRTVGIEPSPNLAKHANDCGIPTRQDYFTYALAREIKEQDGEANFFIANHMFANVDDSADFVKGVKHLLSPKGVFTMQTFYQVDVLQKNLIENFTHEHLSYFNVKPYRDFLARHGMKLFDVQRIEAKGGAIRCFAEHADGPYPVKPSVRELVSLEEELEMQKAGTYATILHFINDTKSQFHALLGPIKAAGKSIAGFGTSIGATTFVFQYDLGRLIDFFVDDDPYRHYLVSPVYHIPVLPTKTIYERKPDYVIILAPLYAEKIMKNNQDYLRQGGKFILFWPEFRVIEEVAALA